MRFRIFGNGAFGTALGTIFHKNMLLEDSLGSEFAPIVDGDIMIPAVPSDVCVMVIEKLLKFGRPDAIMLVSKGLASNQVLSNECNFDIPILFFAGPNLAKEIASNVEFLSATIAGPVQFTRSIKEFLDDMIIDTTQDLIMPQISAVIKNVTAFVIGYLQPNQNARATLIMQGMKEAVELSRKLGSKENDFLRGCFGDFVLTCTSEHSRNYKAGKAMKEGDLLNETQESLKSVDNIYEMKGDLKLPIIEFFYNLIKHNRCETDLLHKTIAAQQFGV